MRKHLLALLFFIIYYSCFGQQSAGPKYHLKQFTDENGLPQNTIQDFAFGDFGFLWITTQGGLVRFDGQQMVTYSRKELSVNSDRYVGVGFNLETGPAILTAITEDRQLVMIKGGTAFKDPRTREEQLAGLRLIQSQLLSKDIRLDTTRDGDNFLKYKIIVASPQRYYLYVDQKVAFYENGTLKGIIPFKGTPYFKPLPAEPQPREQLIKQTKELVCLDNFMSISNSLFYHQGSEGPVLLKCSTSGTVPIDLTGDILSNPAYAAQKNRIRIFTNRFKGQAFAYLRGSTYQITYQEATGRLDTKLLIADLDIEEKLIHRMLYDEGNGTLFLGSISQGMFMARPNLFQVTGQGKHNEFNNFFYAHLPYSDSSVYVPEGFVISRTKALSVGDKMSESRAAVSRFGMLRDRDGGIWGIDSRSFRQLSPQGRRMNMWKTGRRQPERLYQGSAPGIWIGYDTGELAYLPHRSDSSQQPQVLAKLPGRCTFLHQDRPGKLWVGTSSGLFLYDSLRNATYPVRGLARKTIRSIFHVEPGELWITTYGDGIFLLKDSRLFKMPLDNKKYLAHAHCILDDNNGYFWISANKGLFRASRQDMLDYAAGKIPHVLYLYHNKDEGFLTNEFNGGCQPCGVKLADGHFSFPSMNGLVWFKPENIPLPDLTAPIRLEGFTLDEQPVNPSDTIHLPYNYKHFSLSVKSPFMGLAENVVFLYALRKSPKDTLAWTRVENAERIDLYRMEAGVYTLVVRQTVGFGGKYIDRRLTLIVGSAWFLSWWFILLVILALGMLIWQVTRWRVRSLLRQNASLTRKVEERTIDLSKTLEELKVSDEALQMQLQIQMRIIGAINHDLHAPLRFLSVYVPRYLEQVSQQPDDPETVRLGTSIGKSTLKVYRLADELLMFIKATYNKKGKIVYETTPLKEILDKKVQFFSEIAQENLVTIEADCPPDLTITTNRVMAEIIIHNLLDNALKHTYAQAIYIAASREDDDHVKVTITDSGLGMDTGICEWLSHSNEATGSDLAKPTETPPNLGLGLIMVREITVLLGIQINAVSNSHGTRIALTFSE